MAGKTDAKQPAQIDRKALSRQVFGKRAPGGVIEAQAIAEAKKVLSRLIVLKDGQPFQGDPADGAFQVSWGERRGDARSGSEIVALLHCLFPAASFEWKE